MSPVYGGPSLRQDMALVNRLAVSAPQSAIPTDPVDFCKRLLGFQPTPYQEKFLKDSNQFIALRWSRQSGKSYIVSARLMWQVLLNNGTHVAIVAPSYRQSKLVLRKISTWMWLLPKSLLSTVGKT